VYDPEVELSGNRLAEAASLVERHGIGVHAVLFSMPPARWPGGAMASAGHAPVVVRAVVETGRRAADLGARVLGVWPGADLDRGARDGWSRTADSLAAIVDDVAEPALEVAVEPKPGQVVGTTEDALRISEEVGSGRLGVLLDTAHALAGGEDLPALPERIGGRLFHVHLGDSDGADADADLPPGSVHDFAPFLASLDRADYPGALSFDLYGAVSAGGFTGATASRRGLDHIRAAMAAGRSGAVHG
jgi:sugar phosphate isomerase/epimerase